MIDILVSFLSSFLGCLFCLSLMNKKNKSDLEDSGYIKDLEIKKEDNYDSDIWG